MEAAPPALGQPPAGVGARPGAAAGGAEPEPEPEGQRLPQPSFFAVCVGMDNWTGDAQHMKDLLVGDLRYPPENVALLNAGDGPTADEAPMCVRPLTLFDEASAYMATHFQTAPPPRVSGVDELASFAIGPLANLEQELERGRADEAMAAGTRLRIPGRGEATYISFEWKLFGANEHTVEFAGGERAVVDLKQYGAAAWRVRDRVIWPAFDVTSAAFWEEAGRAAGVGDAAMLATIRTAFTEPRDPTELRLTFKSIGEAGAAGLGATLGPMDAPLPFEAINLMFNELTAAGMRSIAQGMGRGRLPNLRVVVVSGNALGDDGMAALAEALADCASLEELHFVGCGVGGAGFGAVAAVVPHWPRLRVLSADCNPGPSDALGRALAAALPSLPDAEHFYLSDSGLGEGAAAALRAAEAAAGSGVTLWTKHRDRPDSDEEGEPEPEPEPALSPSSADVTSDAFWEEAGRAAGLGDAAVVATIRAACTEPRDPTTLDLNGAGLGEAGAAVVGAALRAMDPPLPVEKIWLNNNGLTAAGMRSIAVGMMGRGRLPNLRRVVVYANRTLGDGGAAALAEALADCASLEELNFNLCGVGGAGFEAVAAQVPRWLRLRTLTAGDNPGPSDALGRALAAALPSLPDAQGFHLRDSGLGEGAAAELRAARAAAGSGVSLSLD